MGAYIRDYGTSYVPVKLSTAISGGAPHRTGIKLVPIPFVT